MKKNENLDVILPTIKKEKLSFQKMSPKRQIPEFKQDSYEMYEWFGFGFVMCCIEEIEMLNDIPGKSFQIYEITTWLENMLLEIYIDSWHLTYQEREKLAKNINNALEEFNDLIDKYQPPLHF
jgi:hypothetical protein